MLQYLGFMFDGENIYIRSSSLARYSEKMKRGVSLAKKTMKKYNAIRAKKGLPEEVLYKRKLYSRYTHFGGRNFITYGLRAANKMNSKTIKHQLKPLWRRFNEELEKT
jgi:RNA-directed DNA polymerase